MTRTTDNILEYFNTAVKERLILSPQDWVEAAEYLNILIGEEHDKLFGLEQEVAQKKIEALKTSKSVAEAKLIVEGTDTYRAMRTQKGKIEQIQEFIRIAKLQARLKSDEIRGY